VGCTNIPNPSCGRANQLSIVGVDDPIDLDLDFLVPFVKASSFQLPANV